MKTIALLTSLAVCTVSIRPLHAVDEVGQQAQNFTLTNHFTSQPLRLYDHAGSVILLDYFAYWCPYCRAQSPQIEAGINDYFKQRGGNTNGVPVTVITVSFDGSSPATTDQFIAQFGLDLVADDHQLTSYQQFGVSGQPFYVIINGVTNSTSHAPWEVLYRQSSYGMNVAPTSVLRTVINTVQPGPQTESVMITDAAVSNGTFHLTIPAQAGRTNRVEYSTNLADWTTLTNLTGVAGPVTITDSASDEQRFYRLVRP